MAQTSRSRSPATPSRGPATNLQRRCPTSVTTWASRGAGSDAVRRRRRHPLHHINRWRNRAHWRQATPDPSEIGAHIRLQVRHCRQLGSHLIEEGTTPAHRGRRCGECARAHAGRRRRQRRRPSTTPCRRSGRPTRTTSPWARSETGTASRRCITTARTPCPTSSSSIARSARAPPTACHARHTWPRSPRSTRTRRSTTAAKAAAIELANEQIVLQSTTGSTRPRAS